MYEKQDKEYPGSPCPKGFHKCGQGDADHSLCVPEGDECPINDVRIGSAPPGFKSVELGDGTMLGFSSSGEGLPVVRFRLSEGEVCADKRDFDISPNR